MKIAFISYEYPPDTGKGGIATYVFNAASMLQNEENYIEVFAGTNRQRSYSVFENGILVHRIAVNNRLEFAAMVSKPFSDRHHAVNFDVLEGPEYYADARFAIKEVPDIPLVIKIHTPKFLINRLNLTYLDTSDKIRFILGGLLRGRIVKPFWKYNHENDIEYLHTKDADEIACPCLQMKEILIKEWKLKSDMFSIFPLPYLASSSLLEIPINTSIQTVTFIGRLEMRKGVHLFAHIIPSVVKECPDVLFRFIGQPLPSPVKNLNMQQYLEYKLPRYKKNIEFIGRVKEQDISYWLSNTCLAVFPSLFESFGYVCLEAMSAGRGIVASNKGGMNEMLAENTCGILASPDRPQTFAQGIVKLLNNPECRMMLGENARKRVIEHYSKSTILKIQLEVYSKAIERRKKVGPRKFYD